LRASQAGSRIHIICIANRVKSNAISIRIKEISVKASSAYKYIENFAIRIDSINKSTESLPNYIASRARKTFVITIGSSAGDSGKTKISIEGIATYTS
jgi:hypothetical protein